MKKRWMRRVSAILVLCMLFNDNLTGAYMRTQAEESHPPVASLVESESVSDGEVMPSEDTVSSGNVDDSVQEKQENIKEHVIENRAYSLAVEGNPPILKANNNQYTMPGDLATYLEARASGKNEFFIATEQDYIDAQNLSGYAEVNGFAGVILTILEPNNADKTWHIENISDFSGIGTAEHPFQGTLRCYYENGEGVRFTLDKPLLAYMGNGAKFSQFDMKTNTSCAAIAQYISGNVTISDVWVEGTIGNGSGTVGTIAAEVASNSNVVMDAVIVNLEVLELSQDGTPIYAEAHYVSGTIAGNIAGIIGDNVVFSMSDTVDICKSIAVEVTGTEAAGGCYGVVKGSHTWNLAEKNLTNAKVVCNSATCYAGQFAGQLLSDNGSGTLTVVGGNSLSAKLDCDNSIIGGVVGLCGEATQIVLSEGSLTISGSIDSAGGVAGGVVGRIINSQMELANYTITARIGGAYAGGIVGQIQGGKYIIRNINVAEVTGPTATGGVVAEVTNSAAIELQGKISLTSVSPHGNGSNGYVVGKQDKSLIYLSEHEGLLNGVSQLSYIYDDREDIGTYGGLYRNQNIAGGKLIGNGTLAKVGVINNTVAKNGDWYQLTSAADFEALAIVLGTEGNFGSNAFGGANWKDLLTASYTVTKNVDISYDKTGIITLNRNDKVQNVTYAFDGVMQGVNNAITITQNIAIKHKHGGLFNTLTGSVEFKNLIIDGTVQNANYAGGIASQITNGKSITLTNVTVKKNFVNNTGYIGGFIGQQTQTHDLTLTAENITLACEMNMANNQNFAGFIAQISKANVEIDGVTLAGSIKSQTGTSIGGFLGRTWKNTAGTIKNITVEPGAEYSSTGVFGVLWLNLESQSEKYLTLDTITLNGLTVKGRTGKSNCSLLVQNATKLVANIIDYDSTGCTVSDVGNNFDEVAGVTRSDSSSTTLPSKSGIVSLHSTAADFPNYHYENKATYSTIPSRTSCSTVYYYDVFQHLENADGSAKVQIAGNNILDSAEKMLLWNVVQMADSSIRNTFKKFFATNAVPANASYSFSGTLDLSSYSIYPTPYTGNINFVGQNNAKIIFSADTMSDWSLDNETVGSPHYAMHGGLFYNAGGHINLQVSNLVLSGKIAHLGTDSGALLPGNTGLTGGGIFKNITLDNLWIQNYNKEAQRGLLIAYIPANSATFDGIKMTGYSLNSNVKAASALIGSAGGGGVVNLVLKFSNMSIADDKNGDNAKNHNGDVLEHASFLYYYDFTDDATVNNGSGIYLFSEEDARVKKVVTYGKELDENIEFSDNSKQVLATMGISSEDYKPYVYRVEKIDVNPKTGDILKGCGTYEDPYIIQDVKQFLTLYRYINEKGTPGSYQNQTFYELGEGWKINKLGTDRADDFCTEPHEITWKSDTKEFVDKHGVVTTDAVIFGKEGFPTPEELSRAYYMLGADIDLTEVTGEYETIAEEFVGFGTDTRPFVGVWYGAGHSITLPEKVSKTYTNYGFIQYAQGAVVKDLTIKSLQADSITASNAPSVNGSGGGVIATILGGDNIIDNVTVKMDIKLQNQNTPVGGYVGLVKKGGLILRNVETADLSGFRMNQNYSESTYCLLGAVVGKVEDGYALYDGAGAGSVAWNGITALNGYPAAPGYVILNGDTLETSALTVGEIIALDNINCDINVSIPDAAGLQIMAMALNADALNVKPSDFIDYTACGYTEKSRSRKANYSSIGHTTINNDDYLKAAKYDNVMGYSENANKAYAYPYLYDYMGITEDAYLKYWVAVDGDGYNVLNPAMPFGTPEGVKVHRITWQLANGLNYDMAQFGNAFRGIGAVYQTGDSHGGTFHGNFDGNDSTITLDLTRKVLASEETNYSVSRVGLFNTIFGSHSAMYHVPADFGMPILEYDADTVYTEGDRVYYKGYVYEAQWWTQGKIPGQENVWKLVEADAGEDSGDEDEPNQSGGGSGEVSEVIDTYKSTIWYAAGDCVVYQGKLYEAQDNTQGVVPGATAAWVVVADSDDAIVPNGIPYYDENSYYPDGSQVVYRGVVFQAKWWANQGCIPGKQEADPWKPIALVASVNAVSEDVGDYISYAEVNLGTSNNNINCFEIKDFKLAGSVNGGGNIAVTTGGVVAYIQNANYIISGITMDGNAPLVVGSNDKTNYAGGIIGILDANSNVLIRDCDLNKAEVYAYQNAGGLVGNQGGTWTDSNIAITLKIEDIQAEQLLINSKKESAGGLVGHVYAGELYLAGSKEKPISVSNSTIKGSVTGGHVGRTEAKLYAEYVNCMDSAVGTDGDVSSTGGIIGVIKGNVAISNAQCSNLSLISYSCIGGIAGKATGSSGVITIKNVSVTNSSLKENSNFNGEPEGLGGIIGLNQQKLSIQNASVVGTKTNDTYNFQIRGNKEVRNNMQGVGGIVGCHIASSNKLTLKDCMVNTVDISTDISISGSYKGQMLGAGGIVGIVAGEVVLDRDGEITTQNLNVRAPLISEVGDVAVMAAGGAFGVARFQKNQYNGAIWGGNASTYYSGLTAENNTVTGKYAGGLIGYNNLAQSRLSGVTVKNGTVQGDDAVGGVIGYLLTAYDGVAFNPTPVSVVSNMKISGKIAGGAFGYLKIQGPMRVEGIEIKGNVIQSTVDMSERIAGGLLGACEAIVGQNARFYDVKLMDNTIVAETAGSTVSEEEAAFLAVGGVIGKTVENKSSKEGSYTLDGIYVENTNRIGVRQTGTDAVKLLKTNGNGYQLSDIEKPATGEATATDMLAIEALEQDFGYNIGSFVGAWKATYSMQMYIIDTKERNGKFTPPVMANNPPVVDVGRTATQGVDDYRKYCHIIYGATKKIAVDVKNNLADMKAEVQKIESEYTGQETYAELLKELRVSQKTVDLFNVSYQDSYKFPGMDLEIDFPILVYRIENGTLQDVMESVTDVMTNLAGESSSDMKILNIKCTPKLFDGKNVTDGTVASISASVTNGVATYTMEDHDGVTDGKLSYTELTYTYYGSGEKVFSIPVFVEEPILYSVHSRIMEGKISDVSTIRTNGMSEENNSIIMANDSDYVLLLEYTYGKAREQMADGVTVDKVFYMEQNGVAQSLPLGTQLLLVDVTGGNKAYYYTVTDEDVTHINFTDFTDGGGANTYVNRSINSLPDILDEGKDYYTDLGGHQLTETGVERYLLTVLSNDNDTKSKVYSIHAGVQIDDESLKARFQLEKDHAKETVWNITANPGLTVSLINRGSGTEISGVISKSDGLTVKATFALQAQDIYWAQKSRDDVTVIDSSNSGKYLEIAFYLRDGSGNRVTLPDGTNFSYKLGDGSYSGNRIIPDDTIVYYYKDIRNQFEMDDFEYLISNISHNTIVPVEYFLDFGGADLSMVLDDSYVAWIELLRTANKDYPMGNNNTVDSYSKVINASAMQELGFALRSDDLRDLAINTYPVPQETNQIPGHIMFDFSENLKIAGMGVGRDMVLEKWSSLDYQVTYQVYKKTQSGYVPYTGDDIVIRAYNPETGMEESGENASLSVTYHFTENEIESGNGEEPVEGVLSFPCRIVQNTANLVADTSNLTNYRVEATLVIKEDGETGETAEKTTDFFVYTVTKLKFDL